MKVETLMSPEPLAVHAEERLERAAHKMADRGVHHLPVIDRRGAVVGVLSQHDLLRATDRAHGTVADLMSTDVKSVAPDTHAHEAAYLLLHHRIGCVPVTDATGRLVGIVTESDFVRVAYRLLGGKVPLDQLEEEEAEAERV